MPDLDWKKSGQDKALEFTGANMLVSASAGSGKTTVMVEKIRRYLAAGGSLTRLVVVTFTRASADDMKEKIETELKELLRTTKDARYKAELRALPISYIGTVDSLCANIYRNYFEDTGGPPSFRVLETDESRELLREAASEVLEEKLSEEDAAFEKFLSYCAPVETEEGFFKAVEGVFRYLDTRSDPEEFFAVTRKIAESDFDDNPAVKYLQEVSGEKFRAFVNDSDYFLSLAEDAPPGRAAKLKGTVSDMRRDFSAILARKDPKGFYEALKNAGEYKKPGAHPSYEGAAREAFISVADFIDEGNKALKEAKARFSDYETDKITEKEASAAVETVLDAVHRVSVRYSELKAKANAFDFSDVERLALKILSENGRAEEFRARTDYVFFDEYQDVNPLQEAIISLISKDNLFMVGDVKQSIYRFRHSEPKLFLKRYREYGGGHGGSNVPLNMNFRSSQPILDFTDRIFSKIMTPRFGGVDYSGSSRFNKAGLDVETSGFVPVRAVFFPKPDPPVYEFPEVYSLGAAPKAAPERDAEAEFVADDVLRSVANDLIPVKGGGVRKMRYSDIAVLARDSKTAKRFIREFAARGIPCDSNVSGQLFDKSDIDKLTAFLRLIDNPLQDFPLAAAMLSEGGGFDEKELYDLSAAGEGESFYERIYSSRADGAAGEKLKEFLAAIARYRKLAPLTDVVQLIGTIAAERGFLTAMASEPERLDAYNAYLKFISERECSASVTAFLKWRAGEDAVPEGGGTGTGVSVMTMHRSKGLEFPSVYVVGAGNATGSRISSAVAVADPEFGLGLKAYDEESRSSKKPLTRLAIELKNAFEEKQEEARLAYVALTRARYRLRVTGTVSASEKIARVPENASSLREWMLMAAEDDPVLSAKIETGELPREKSAPAAAARSDYDGGEIRFFEYPFAASTAVSNKYTVTSLNEYDPARSDDDSGEYTPVLGARGTETGNIYHRIMERMDFSDRGEEGVGNLLAKLASEGENVESVDVKQLVKTLSLPLFDYAAANKTLREQPFMYYVPANEVLPTDARDKVLVQGVMDLVILGEKTVLVDYKVSGADEKTLKERYSAQLELYAAALGEATGKYPDKKLIVVLNRALVLEI